MPEVRPNVMLIRYTPAPEELVAMAGKLCYSPSTLDDLAEGVAEHDQTKYLKKLTDMGHMSPIPSVDDLFRKLETETVAEPAPKAPIVEPAPNASYDSIYGDTYKCIVKNKRR